MDIAKVLAELRQELENVDAAILSLERLQTGTGRKRRTRETTATTEEATVLPIEAPGKIRKRPPTTPKTEFD
jgi:hypothetical protein